jgi:hypothetical protein
MISTAAVVQFPSIRGLRCSACNATTSASCDCGAAYVPAGDIAVTAIVANPEKSDRAIAAEIGVNKNTVARARAKTTGPNGPIEKRTGKDGKKRRVPDPKEAKPKVDRITDQQRWEWSAANFAGDTIAMRAKWTRQFGNWEKFERPPALVKLIDEAAKAWSELASMSRAP